MSQSRDWVEYARSLFPGWPGAVWRERLLTVWGLVMQSMEHLHTVAVLQRSPRYASADALERLSDARLLPRMPWVSTSEHGQYLADQTWQYWEYAGTAQALQTEIRRVCGDLLTVFEHRSDTAYTGLWHHYSIVIEYQIDEIWETYWDDLGYWDDGGLWDLTVTASWVARLRTAIREHAPAETYARWLVLKRTPAPLPADPQTWDSDPNLFTVQIWS